MTPASTLFVFIEIALSIIAAGYTYSGAQRFRAQTGVSPWHLPPWLWGAITFCFWLIGIVLFAVARATTRHRPVDAGSPAIDQPVQQVVTGEGHLGRTFGTNQPPSQARPPAGWYADPGRRHELRFWDGKGWTEHVSDGGERGIDPGN